MKSPPLRGKVVLITGGTSPIGRSMALTFAEAGARVAVHYRRNRSGAEKLARRCRGIALHGLLPGDAESIVGETCRRLGRLDLLVNNASHIERAGWTDDLERMTDRMWRDTFETDVLGSFRCVRAAARRMKRGRIILIGSVPALSGDREGIIYSTMKAAVIGMTKSLALLLAPRIQVNCMALGSVETGWERWLTPRQRKSYEAAIPLQRFGRPEDVARLALFLATSDWTTGQTCILDGGEVRR